MGTVVKKWMMKLMGLPTCEEISEFAYAYLDGELDPGQAAKFERHLDGCENCKRFVASYRAVARPQRLARPIPLDPEFEHRIVEFLKREGE